MEHAASRITKNSTLALIAKASEFAVGAITLILATRYLGLKTFGEYAFLSVIAFTLNPVITWGTLRILIREISIKKDKTSVFLSSGLVLNILLAIVVLVIASIIIFAFHLMSKNSIIAFYLALLSQIIMVMTKTIDTVFIAYEKMIYSFLVTFSSRIVSIIFFLMVIYYDMGIIGLFMALVAANTVGLFSAFLISTYKFVKPQWNINIRYLNYLFKESFPVAISTFMYQGYTNINVFLLKIFQDIVQISLFQAPQRIIAPLFLLPSSFMLAFVPTLSRLGSNNGSYSDLQYAYHKTMKYILIFTLPFTICGTILAPWIVLLLFGKEFSEASATFQILIWTIIPLFANVLLSFILTSIREQKVLIISGIICFIANGVLGLILVPKYGSIGASIGSLFSYVVLFGVNFYYVSKKLEFIPLHRIALQPFFAGSIMYLFIFLLVGKYNMPLLIISAFAVYFGFLFLFKTFTSDEIELFKSIIIKKRKVQ